MSIDFLQAKSGDGHMIKVKNCGHRRQSLAACSYELWRGQEEKSNELLYSSESETNYSMSVTSFSFSILFAYTSPLPVSSHLTSPVKIWEKDYVGGFLSTEGKDFFQFCLL